MTRRGRPWVLGAALVVAVVATVTTATTTTAGATTGPCPTYAEGVDQGDVLVDDLEEASGVAAGRVNPDVVWAHPDSGNSARLVALDATDASLVASFDLTGATNVDWEDIAIGRGPTAGQSYLYVGDIGGNVASPANVVYRVPEPVIDPAAGLGPHPLGGAVALPFTYPDGTHNAETLMIDPRTGDLIIVTKALGPARVFRRPAPQATSPVELSVVFDLNFAAQPLAGWLTTGGDISPSGSEILIRTYSTAYVWHRAWGQTVEEALAGDPCPVPLASEPQGEAAGYAADGTGYATLSERTSIEPEPMYDHRCLTALTDLPAWATSSARWLVCNDYAAGYEDDTFRPVQPITRAAAARILHRIAGTPTPDDPTACNHLTDIPTWADDAICWLIDQNHATGYHDDTFRPLQPITRAAAARILHRIAGTPTPDDPTACNHLTDIPTWADDAICWLIDQNHATGYHDDTFRPLQPITRAAAARILHRINT